MYSNGNSLINSVSGHLKSFDIKSCLVLKGNLSEKRQRKILDFMLTWYLPPELCLADGQPPAQVQIIEKGVEIPKQLCFACLPYNILFIEALCSSLLSKTC